MPSRRHEALVELLRSAPRLVPALACGALGLPPPVRAAIADAGFSQLVRPQHSADLVIVPAPGAPWRGLVVEVQLARVARKRLVWPLYDVALRARLGGDRLIVDDYRRAGLVTLTLDRRMAGLPEVRRVERARGGRPAGRTWVRATGGAGLPLPAGPL